MIGDVREDELIKLKAIANYQFGRNAGEALFKGDIKVSRSYRTGRVRNIYLNGKLIATVRASDGFLALTPEGARLLLKAFRPPKLRVIVPNHVADAIAEGRSVFAKHVIDVDPEIRAGEEVIVVDENDRLLAVGKAVLSAEEMMAFDKGVAVKVRKGVKDQRPLS